MSRKVARKYLVPILLSVLVIAPPLAVYWTVQRINQHATWEEEFREAQTFALYHMETAASLAANGNTSNQTALNWGRNEMTYASTSIGTLSKLDRDHANQLSRIFLVLANLGSSWPGYVPSLTSLQRTTLSSLLNAIGNKILNAYSILNYTGTDVFSGAPFWYSGPSPPNEALLQQAMDLAVNWTDLPSLPP